MVDRTLRTLSELVADAALALALVSSLFALVIGLLMWVNPPLVQRLGARLNRRVSLRRPLKALEVPRPTERWFYRHHRAMGALLVLAAAFYFYVRYVEFEPASAVRTVARYLPPVLAGWLVESLVLVFTLGNGLVLAVGLVVLVRPSLLKPVEAWANRWLSTRRALKPLDTPHEPLDRLYERRPRLVAGFVIAGSLYAFLSFAVLTL